ncbi:MAG TPA: hypothetical protein PLK76_03385 [bacterium]|nr:hypothetical protein [bacterium]
MEILLEYFSQVDFGNNPLASFGFILAHGGFIFVVYALVSGFILIWLNSRQGIFASKLKYVCLAIDAPRNSEQSPKAIEQIFNQLWGIVAAPTFSEKWLDGKFQVCYSLELVSVGGYVQYIIRAQDILKDLVEAAIYAQYPEAQISLIEDYTKDITPENFKELGYDLWGAQLQELKDEAYPIKTYPQFEHAMARTIVDPTASVLEIFSKFRPGEMGWLQIIIKPVMDPDWQPGVLKEAKKIMGVKEEGKKQQSGLADSFLNSTGNAITKMADSIFVHANVEAKEEKKNDLPSKMLYLSPAERATVEAIENKASKTGFQTKIRYIYLGKKPGMNKATGVSGFWGAFKAHAGLNGFKPLSGTMTSIKPWEKKIFPGRLYDLQKKILRNYKSRSMWAGINENRGKFVLNVEELASLYHFPYVGVGTAAIKSVGAKRAEAPYILPTETEEDIAKEELRLKKNKPTINADTPATNDAVAKNVLDKKKNDIAEIEIPPDNLPI